MSRIGTCQHGVALNTWCERCHSDVPPDVRDAVREAFEVRVMLNEQDESQAAQADEPRALVRAFALAMERKLAANDATKGGWRDEHFVLLLDDLEGEIAELRAALHGHVDVGRYAPPDVQAVLLEAADVALYAMMIADVCGALPPTDERGR